MANQCMQLTHNAAINILFEFLTEKKLYLYNYHRLTFYKISWHLPQLPDELVSFRTEI